MRRSFSPTCGKPKTSVKNFRERSRSFTFKTRWPTRVILNPPLTGDIDTSRHKFTAKNTRPLPPTIVSFCQPILIEHLHFIDNGARPNQPLGRAIQNLDFNLIRSQMSRPNRPRQLTISTTVKLL